MKSANVLKFSLSRTGVYIGTMWGVNLLLLAILSVFFGLGGSIIALLGTLYVGYTTTIVGGIIGLVLGFLHGYIIGVVGDVFMRLFKR